MTPYWTALFAVIAGIFTLAFKWRESFDRLNTVMVSICPPVGTFIVGTYVGALYGRSGSKVFDDLFTPAVWVFNLVVWASIVANWLAPPKKD